VIASPTRLLRTGAAAAALVLAVLSRGDALVLAALLVTAAWRVPALAVVPALVSSSWRWGSTSLDALAGAQDVLGPAGSVGPGRAATAAWLAAAALVLSAPAAASRAGARPSGVTQLTAAAFAVAAADVVAGPTFDGAWWARAVATAVAIGLALSVTRLRSRLGQPVDALAIVAALVALLAAAGDAPSWAGTIDSGAMRTAAVLAAAVVAATFAGGWVIAAMGNRDA
jgi:hypothetical protein